MTTKSTSPNASAAASTATSSQTNLVTSLAGLLVLVRKLHLLEAIDDQQRAYLKHVVLQCDPTLLEAFDQFVNCNDRQALIQALLAHLPDGFDDDGDEPQQSQQQQQQQQRSPAKSPAKSSDDAARRRQQQELEHQQRMLQAQEQELRAQLKKQEELKAQLIEARAQQQMQREREMRQLEQLKRQQQQQRGQSQQLAKQETAASAAAATVGSSSSSSFSSSDNTNNNNSSSSSSSAGDGATTPSLTLTAQTAQEVWAAVQRLGFDTMTLKQLWTTFASAASSSGDDEDGEMIDQAEFVRCGLTLLEGAADPAYIGAIFDSLFSLLDRDREGRVDLAELLCGLALLCDARLDDKLVFSFDVLDVDGDGHIEPQDVFRYMFAVSTTIWSILFHRGDGNEQQQFTREEQEEVVWDRAQHMFTLIDAMPMDAPLTLETFMQCAAAPAAELHVLVGSVWSRGNASSGSSVDEQQQQQQQQQNGSSAHADELVSSNEQYSGAYTSDSDAGDGRGQYSI